MPVTAVVGQKYLVTLKGTMDNQQIRNTFWYQLSAVTGVPTTAQVETSMNTILQAGGGFTDLFLVVAPANYRGDSVSIQCVEPTRVRGQDFLWGQNGNAGNCDAPGTAAVVTLMGDLSGRSHQCTKHLPCSTDPGDIAAGFTQAGYFAALQAFANACPVPITGIAPGYTASPIIRNGPANASVTPIITGAAKSTIRTMRRRVVGRGI